MGDLKPHVFSPHVESMVKPKIFLTPQVVQDIKSIARHDKTEIGFMGLVEHVVTEYDDGSCTQSYIINELFLPEQQTHSATTEITPKGMADLANTLMTRGDGSDYDKLRCWIHTHPFGSTHPSGQDDNQMHLFRRAKCDYFIRGIVGRDRIEFTLYLYSINTIVKDVPWEISLDAEDRDAYWAEQVASNVKGFGAGFTYGGEKGIACKNYGGGGRHKGMARQNEGLAAHSREDFTKSGEGNSETSAPAAKGISHVVSPDDGLEMSYE